MPQIVSIAQLAGYVTASSLHGSRRLREGVLAKHLLILILSSCVTFAVGCGLDTQPTTLPSSSTGRPGVGGSAAPGSGAKPGTTPRPDEDPDDEGDVDERDVDEDDVDEDDVAVEVDRDDATDDDDATCESCDDDDACTRDRETTRNGDCACSHTPITRMRDGDRCCPAGAGPGDDADCGPVAACGNGQIDAGEECDGGGECGQDCTLLFGSSLVHRYSFEGEGEAVVDSVGDGDGRFVKGRLQGDGDLVLPGALVYAELPDGLISGLTSATIEFWITTVRGGGGQRVFDFGDDTPGGQGATYWAMTPASILDGNPMTIVNVTPEAENLGGGDQYVSGPSPVEPGTMRHFAVVFDDEARTLSLYMDGRLQRALQGLDGQLSDIDDSNVWLGRAQFDAYPFFNGRIHEFRIYDEALTAALITRSFAAGPDPE
jgi:hypothetical protein